MYGDQAQETPQPSSLPDGLKPNIVTPDEELGMVALHSLRLALLDALIQKIQAISSVGGVTSIPFFQVRTIVALLVN